MRFNSVLVDSVGKMKRGCPTNEGERSSVRYKGAREGKKGIPRAEPAVVLDEVEWSDSLQHEVRLNTSSSSRGQKIDYKRLYEEAEASNVILKLKVNYLQAQCGELMLTQQKVTSGLKNLETSFTQWCEDYSDDDGDEEEEEEQDVCGRGERVGAGADFSRRRSRENNKRGIDLDACTIVSDSD